MPIPRVKLVEFENLDMPEPAIKLSHAFKITYKELGEENDAHGMWFSFEGVNIGFIFVDDNDPTKWFVHKYGERDCYCKRSFQESLGVIQNMYNELMKCGCASCLIEKNSIQARKFRVTGTQQDMFRMSADFQ